MNRHDVRVLEVAFLVSEIRRQQRLPERNPQELQAARQGGRAAAVHPEDHESDGTRRRNSVHVGRGDAGLPNALTSAFGSEVGRSFDSRGLRLRIAQRRIEQASALGLREENHVVMKRRSFSHWATSESPGRPRRRLGAARRSRPRPTARRSVRAVIRHSGHPAARASSNRRAAAPPAVSSRGERTLADEKQVGVGPRRRGRTRSCAGWRRARRKPGGRPEPPSTAPGTIGRGSSTSIRGRASLLPSPRASESRTDRGSTRVPKPCWRKRRQRSTSSK